jgi:hypothetical protein
MLVVTGGYQNYHNGDVGNQLRILERGLGECMGVTLNLLMG